MALRHSWHLYLTFELDPIKIRQVFYVELDKTNLLVIFTRGISLAFALKRFC